MNHLTLYTSEEGLLLFGRELIVTAAIFAARSKHVVYVVADYLELPPLYRTILAENINAVTLFEHATTFAENIYTIVIKYIIIIQYIQSLIAFH